MENGAVVHDAGDPKPRLTIVIPAFDEAQSIAPLANELVTSLQTSQVDSYEVIVVDDGSSDGTWDEITQVSRADRRFKGLRLRRNFGKATALSQGILRSRADIIITMDADLQDDPSEIPRFIDALDSGYDLVCGWKRLRRDPWSKKFPSKVFNVVTSRLTGVRLHDFNCGYKAYRAEVLRAVPIYGELYRYIPALAHSRGFRITEIAVHHNPRRYGKSKYGLERFTRGILDLFTVLAITQYASRPAHLFGGIGLFIGTISGIALMYLLYLKLFVGPIGTRPLLQVSLMLAIVAIQFVLFGVLAELILQRRGPLNGENLTTDQCGFAEPPR